VPDPERAVETGLAAGDPDWPRGWEEHKRRQLVSFLAATPAQRLAWLEEIIDLAFRAGALPRARTDADR
jgi:hypothetical protein